IQGIQFLIKEGIMKIPTTHGASTGSNEIPSWIKNNAGWWADGSIDDNSFISGIEFLVKQGIITP
ncbi:MAG: peptidase, partial [Nitrosopumilus sp.]|nr:peptidase [Nitrosopumilus sp.]